MISLHSWPGNGEDPAVVFIAREVTGISTSNERGVPRLDIEILSGEERIGMLTMNIDEARMIRTALHTMKVLDG